MRLALAMLLLVLIAGTASAQRTFDAKGGGHQCPPGNRSCSLLPQRGAPWPSLRRPRPTRPKVEECGSRCDLLDRMK